MQIWVTAFEAQHLYKTKSFQPFLEVVGGQKQEAEGSLELSGQSICKYQIYVSKGKVGSNLGRLSPTPLWLLFSLKKATEYKLVDQSFLNGSPAIWERNKNWFLFYIFSNALIFHHTETKDTPF